MYYYSRECSKIIFKIAFTFFSDDKSTQIYFAQAFFLKTKNYVKMNIASFLLEMRKNPPNW